MAVSHICGLSLDERVRIFLSTHPDLVERIFEKITDAPFIANQAWNALINLSLDSRMAEIMARNTDQVVKVVESSTSIFGDLACMLLSNLAKTARGQEILVESLDILVPIFMNGHTHNRNCNYDFIASVLADVTTIHQGRLYFLKNLQSLFTVLLSQLTATSVIRRGGTTTALKNCLFEISYHKTLLDMDEEDERLLSTLVGRLACPKQCFSEKELDSVILDIQLELRHTDAESDVVIRSIVVECLLILCTTFYGREIVRRKNIVSCFYEY